MISTLEIEEIKPNELTRLTKDALIKCGKKYDLSEFSYTKKIQISSNGSSCSYPVLTLSTKNANYPERILSTFLHEQFHW